MKAALVQIPDKIRAMINDYEKDLEEAWALTGSTSLKINFSIKIGFDRNDKPACEVGIHFNKGVRIKDTTSFNWDNRQLSLIKTIDHFDQKLKSDGVSATIKDGAGNEIAHLGADLKEPDPDSLPEDTNAFYTKSKEERKRGAQ